MANPANQLPDHYRLLGLNTFERDAAVIAKAVDQRTAHAESRLTGEQAAVAQRTLKAIAAAKACLLDPQQKAAYDKQLRKKLISGVDDLPPPAEADEAVPGLPATLAAPGVVAAKPAASGEAAPPRKHSWAMSAIVVILVAAGIGGAAYVWNRGSKELAQNDAPKPTQPAAIQAKSIKTGSSHAEPIQPAHAETKVVEPKPVPSPKPVEPNPPLPAPVQPPASQPKPVEPTPPPPMSDAGPKVEPVPVKPTSVHSKFGPGFGFKVVWEGPQGRFVEIHVEQTAGSAVLVMKAHNFVDAENATKRLDQIKDEILADWRANVPEYKGKTIKVTKRDQHQISKSPNVRMRRIEFSIE